MNHRIIATASLLALLTALEGQDIPRRTPGSHDGLPVDRVLFDRHPDGTVWAVGRTYKMKFGDGAAQFVPFFGSTAPRNFPITIALRQLTAGGTPVPLLAGSAADHSGDRVAFAHGAVQERWDLSLTGAEQTFVLSARPGDGDLVLQLTAATELAVQAADHGIDFANGYGRVHYGQAVLVDAHGARTPLSTTPRNGEIVIEVPATVLEHAAFPVLVDPLVMTTSVGFAGYNEHNADSCYDAANDLWMLVWEGDFSATDHDLLSTLHFANGALVSGSLLYIDSTTDSWVDPRIASHRQQGVALVVAQRVIPDQQIWGRLRSLGGSATGPQFQISSNFGSHPDVGGDGTASAVLRFFVVWHRGGITGATIVGRQVSGSVPFGGEVTLGSGFTNISFPEIANSAGADSALGLGWPVVWPVPAQSTAAPHRIRGVFVQSNGTPQGPEADWFSNAAQPMQRPSVSTLTDPIGNQRLFMVTWQQDVGGAYDIFAGVRSMANNAIVPATDISPLLGVGSSYEQEPAVDSFGSRFCVTFAYSSVFFPYDIRAATLDLVSNGGTTTIGLVEQSVFLSNSTTSSPDNLNPRVCSARSGGGSEPFINPRYLVTWETNGSIGVASYDGYAANGGYSVLPTGCGAFGIYGSGLPHAGGYVSGGLTYGGAAPTVVAFGLPLSPALQLCPNCQLGVDPGTAVLATGPQFVFAVPPAGGFTGFALAVQGIALGPPSCIGGLIFSNTLRVVLQ